jgi:two-component system response regulator YesN
MYSLVIADDEPVERNALLLLVERNISAISEIRLAANGLELVELAIQKAPDIIIADIEMPGMNGLESLRELKHIGVRSHIVILTAFDRFTYAKEAIRLNVMEYLVKPPSRSDIISAVLECIRVIEVEHEEAARRISLETRAITVRPLVEADFISSIIFCDTNNGALENYLRLLDLEFRGGYVLTVYCPTLLSGTKIEGNILSADALVNFVRDRIRLEHSCIVGSTFNQKIIALILMNDEEEVASGYELMQAMARVLRRDIGTEFHLPALIGLGMRANEIKDIPASCRESMLAFSLAEHDVPVSCYDETTTSGKIKNPLLAHCEEIIFALRGRFDGRALRELVDKIIEYLLTQRFSMDRQKDMLAEFFMMLQRRLLESDHDPSIVGISFSRSIALEGLKSIDSSSRLREWIYEQLDTLMQLVEGTEISRYPSPIKLAIQYITINYMRDISLEIVAEHANTSPFHLSHLFSQVLGKTYIRFLTELRMKRAIELMEQKAISISELSRLVGYANPSYFAQQFHKMTGMSIRESHGICYEERDR